MRKGLIFLVIGIFFVGVSVYIFQTFSPFDPVALNELIHAKEISPGDWETLNAELSLLITNGAIMSYLSSNALLGGFTVLAAIFCFFNVLHLGIDKLFFKNFYEAPSLFDALRRGILFIIGVGAVIYMKLVLIDMYVIVLVPVILIIGEVIFNAYLKPVIKRKTVRTL